MSFVCIFHVCFLLEIGKEKKIGNIESAPHYFLSVRGELAPKLVPKKFLRERVPKIKENLLVFEEKFFVATHFGNSIGNITISSNRSQQIAESCNKLVPVFLN